MKVYHKDCVNQDDSAAQSGHWECGKPLEVIVKVIYCDNVSAFMVISSKFSNEFWFIACYHAL